MNRICYIMFIIFLLGCTNTKKEKSEYPENIVTGVKSTAIYQIDEFCKLALNGDVDRIKQYLSEGFNVNSIDSEGRTALMYAAFNGHLDIVKVLSDAGAGINMVDNNGRTALMFASSGSFPESVKFLLEGGADPNRTDFEEKFTALMYAASEGHLETVKILVAGKANLAMKDADGDIALTFALNNGHIEVADFLGTFQDSK